MKAVSDELLSIILTLQELPSLHEARLGGGTSLALRFDHRESVDIDLLFSGIIGKAGFIRIEEDVRAKFGEDLLMLDYPCNIDDQFMFLRFLVRTGDEQIKVEVMQNMIFTEQADTVKGIRILSLNDIGMLKLVTVANRASFKDVYDLCYLTEEVYLPELFQLLVKKQKQYNKKEHQNIFDLDGEVSPVKEPERLLNFEKEVKSKIDRPAHSTNRLKIANGISWLVAQTKWRRRVKELFRVLAIK